MSDAETLPRPEEILDDDRIQYQAMTDLSADEYRRLAEDIRQRGVLQPIIIDESGTILDGHHRAALAEHLDLDESREPAYVVLGDLDDDGDKLARAIKQNLLGRDTGDAVKSHAVKQYIETTWDHTDEGNLIRPETDTEVAGKLGVDRSLVSRVIKNVNAHIIYHERIKAREYYEENPDASYREVSRQVDASQPTVTEWLKEDFDEGDDEGDGDDDISLAVFARNKSEGEKAQETVQKSKDDDADEEVRETAAEKAAEISEGKTTTEDAAAEVEQIEREVEEQREREQRAETRQSAYQNAGETVDLQHGDFREVLADEPPGSVDHIVTDPPYDADALELWAALGTHAAEVLKPGGFLIAYSGKAHLPDVHDVLSSHLNYHWQAIVRHAGPGAKIFSRKLRTNYKPVLIYTKGDADVQDDFITDVIEGGGREKDAHDWQQAESEAAALIESFTEVNDRICDPMCGSGTIGVAADRLDRRCLLIDADREAVETARGKVIE